MQQNTNLIELDKNNPDHLTLMFSVRTHPEVDRYLRGSPPASFNDHVNYLQRVGAHKKFYLIQIDAVLGGYCQLTVTDAHVEIGMALHPDYCNKGIGSMAMSLLLKCMQKNPEINKKPFVLFVKKDNPRAIAVYRKYGFQCVGNENEHGEYLMKFEEHLR